MKKAAIFSLVALVIALATSGCGASRKTGSSVRIDILAAASLTDVFSEIAVAFEAEYPHVETRLIFAGSPTLSRQVQSGAQADLFASANRVHMTTLQEGGHIVGDPQVFAVNQMTIVVRPGNPTGVTGLADLSGSHDFLAFCAAEVPCGVYTRDIFVKAGLAFPNASAEANVKATLNKVAFGAADAAIVYVTDARALSSDLTEIPLPPDLNILAEYPIGVLAESVHPEAAAAFVDFTLGETAHGILKKHGFLLP